MQTFNKTTNWFFGMAAFLLPAVFLVFSSNLFAVTHLMLILIFTALTFGLWAWKNFLNHGLMIAKFNFSVGFFGFFLMVVISTLLIPYAGGLNMAVFGLAGAMILLMLFYCAGVQIVSEESVAAGVKGLTLVSIFLAVLSLLSYASLVSKVVPAAVFSEKGYLSGENGYYLAVFFAVMCSLFIAVSTKKKMAGWGLMGIFATVAGGAILIINLIKPENQVTFLPPSAGWTIAIEIIKNFRHLLFGIGFNQFATYSMLLRPVELNSDKYVFLQFPETSNAYLQLLNCVGVIGFILFGFLLYRVFRNFLLLKNRESALISLLPIASLLLVFLLLPLSQMLLFLFFLFLIFLTHAYKTEGVPGFETKKLNLVSAHEGVFSIQSLQLNEKELNLLTPKLFAGLVGLISAIALFQLIYPLLGEAHYFKMLQAYAANNGNVAYEEINAAVAANQTRDGYYVSLSQVNFQLAVSLNAKKDLSDTDRQNIAILVNQAVTSSQRATQLNPLKEANWENLGSLYQSLINTDKTSGNLAVSAFVQAVNLDPRDPALRVRFAQLLYALKQHDDAISQLNQALAIKSDYANAYYNLGLNYKQLAQVDNAKRAFELARSFVPKSSADEKIIKDALATLQEDVNKIIEEQKNAVTPTPTPTPSGVKDEKKLTEPQEQPKLENMKKELLELQQPTPTGAVVSPTPSPTPTP